MGFRISMKKIIFSFVIILLLLIGGFFLWTLLRDYDQEVGTHTLWQIERIKGETYQITENDLGQKFVENKEYGLKVEVPENWIVEYFGDEIDILSPEVEFNENGGISLDSFKKGACGMSIMIIKSIKVDDDLTTSAEDLKELISGIEQDTERAEQAKEDGYEIIVIDGKKFVKRYLENKDKSASRVSVEIPINDIVYSFDTGVVFSEKCIDEFNQFIKTILIDK
ncbi:MAG: hypothetical protein ABH956_01320 [Candidatus Nealsonbacteria bacterium]